MGSRFNTCRFVCSLATFTFLILWTICSVPAELAYLAAVWTESNCEEEALWKYLITSVLAFTTVGLICFIALSGVLIITIQQKEYEIQTFKKIIAGRRRHNRRRTRDSIPTTHSLPSYSFDDAVSQPVASPAGPPAYMDVIVEHTDRSDVLF